MREGGVRERALLAVAFIGLFAIPALNIATGWPRAARYDPGVAEVAVGSALFVLSLWLFYRSHKDLGRNWSASLEIRERHRIVREGVYSRIRHPMYTSFWLWALAQAFLIANVVAGLSGIAGVAILYFARIDHEERMLVDAFGDEYVSYMRETKRIIPNIH